VRFTFLAYRALLGTALFLCCVFEGTSPFVCYRCYNVVVFAVVFVCLLFLRPFRRTVFVLRAVAGTAFLSLI
jgi:hypothetical protein